MTQYIVAVFLDGTLNVAASGPYRSRDRADAACDALNAAGEWSEAHSDQATIIAQVVPLQPLVDLIEDAQPEPTDPHPTHADSPTDQAGPSGTQNLENRSQS